MCEYFDIHFDEIHLIKELWERNRQYHEDHSEKFGFQYQGLCFEDRVQRFSGLSEENLKITVAKEQGNCVGYCISSIFDSKGELESIHVNASTRGKGIGKELAQQHIDWMRENNCKAIGVTVLHENESTIRFYESMGFFKNTLYMQMD